MGRLKPCITGSYVGLAWAHSTKYHRPCGREWPSGSPDDRRDPSQSASHGLQLVKRGDVPRLIGRTKGGLNSKLHAVCDGDGRPVRLLLTEGQQSDHKGAATLLPDLPISSEMLGDKGYDSDAYRAALIERGITPCIPPRAKRKNPATYCKSLYKQRHKVENMFAKLKDWRRIAMRFDRCAHAFLSAIQIAAVVIFWINQ